MINNNLKTHYYLDLMADPSVTISVREGQLILDKHAHKAKGNLEERIKAVSRYLSAHRADLKPADEQKLRAIEAKFLQEIEPSSLALLDHLKNLNERADQDPEIKEPTIVVQLLPAPLNWETLRSNLRRVFQHYPRYQLTEDLAVIDTKYQASHLDLDATKVYNALRLTFNRYQALLAVSLDRDESIKLTELEEIRQHALAFFKPPKIVQMGIFIETERLSTVNVSVLAHCMNVFKKEKPSVVNQHFLRVFHKQLQEIEADIYLQKEGGLAVILPKEGSLEAFGFDSSQVEKWDKKRLEEKTLDFDQDINSLLLEETPDHRFFRMIYLMGHGGYNKSQQEEYIAGLNVPEFQKAMKVLDEKNTAFLSACSCFIGGENSTLVSLPNESIPYPLHLYSSFDVVTGGTNIFTSSSNTEISNSFSKHAHFMPLLEEVEKLLFPSKAVLTPQPLNQGHFKKLEQTQKIKNDIIALTNLGTFFLPSPSSVPKVAYSPQREEIVDVSRSLRKERMDIQEKRRVVKKEDQSLEKTNCKALLFSESIVEANLLLKGSVSTILLSRGGNNHHFIQKVEAKEQNLEEIAKVTFNAFGTSKLDHERARKAFFIKEFKCKWQGQEATLSNVCIKNFPDQREIIFRIGATYQKMTFVKKDGKEWIFDAVQPLQEKDAVQELHLTVAKTFPSHKMLRQVTAGRFSHQDFLTIFVHNFFGESVESELFKAVAYSAFEGKEKLKSEALLLEASKSFSKEEFNQLLIRLLDIANIFNNEELRDWIRSFSFTPLMKAGLSGHIDEVRRLLDEHPDMINEQDCNGNTALAIFAFQKKLECARLLIEKGAKADIPNRFKNDAFFFMCDANQLDLVQSVIDKGLYPIKGEQGAKALSNAFEQNHLKVVDWLLNHFAGADSKEIAILVSIARSPDPLNRIRWIEKYFTYPHVDPNQHDEFVTALHICIYQKDKDATAFLLNHQADPNAAIYNKHTPLHFVADLQGDPDFVQLLVQAGADINAKDFKNNTPLHLVSYKNNPDLVAAFIEGGADLNAVNNTLIRIYPAKYTSVADLLYLESHETIKQILGKLTAENQQKLLSALLMLAMQKKETDKMEWLLQQPMNVNQFTKQHFDVIKNEIDDPKNLLLFLQYQADLVIQDEYGQDLLYKPVANFLYGQSPETLKQMIGKIKSENQQNLLSALLILAMQKKETDKIEWFLQHPINLNQCIKQNFHVFNNGIHNPKILALFLRYQVDLTIQNKEGKSLLHSVMENDDFSFYQCPTSTYQMLKQAGISLHVPEDKKGITPFMQAFEFIFDFEFNRISNNNSPELLDLLIQDESNLSKLNWPHVFNNLIRLNFVAQAQHLIQKIEAEVKELAEKDESYFVLKLHQAVIEQDSKKVAEWFKDYAHIQNLALDQIDPLQTFLLLNIENNELLDEILLHIPKNYPIALKNIHPLSLAKKQPFLMQKMIQSGVAVPLTRSPATSLYIFKGLSLTPDLIKLLHAKGVDLSDTQLVSAAIEQRDLICLELLLDLGAQNKQFLNPFIPVIEKRE